MGDAQQEVEALLQQWIKLGFGGRPDEQAELEHKRATFTYPGGVRMGRAEHVVAIGHAVRVLEHDVTSYRSEVFGDDTVVVWWEHTLRTELDEDPFDDAEQAARFRAGIHFLVTSVWHREDGRWLVISQDATELPSAFVPREERTEPNVMTYP